MAKSTERLLEQAEERIVFKKKNTATTTISTREVLLDDVRPTLRLR